MISIENSRPCSGESSLICFVFVYIISVVVVIILFDTHKAEPGFIELPTAVIQRKLVDRCINSNVYNLIICVPYACVYG